MSNNYNYAETVKQAQRRFCQRDLSAIPSLTGSTRGANGNLQLKFLTTTYEIDPTGKVMLSGREDTVPLTVKILLLHYLAQGSEQGIENKFISFKELPGGGIYIQPFTNRAIRPLVHIFGDNPPALWQAGAELGGTRANLGDASITLLPFPKVAVTLVLWGGDDEFPASGNILFDSSAAHYLPTEDYAVLASLLVAELKKVKPQP